MSDIDKPDGARAVSISPTNVKRRMSNCSTGAPGPLFWRDVEGAEL
jgi:hypothetical protein